MDSGAPLDTISLSRLTLVIGSTSGRVNAGKHVSACATSGTKTRDIRSIRDRSMVGFHGQARMSHKPIQAMSGISRISSVIVSTNRRKSVQLQKRGITCF